MEDKVPTPLPNRNLVSLTDFIEKHQRLITVIGVFMALGLFWRNYSPGQSSYVTFLCIAITIPLLLEIAKNYKYEQATWNLVAFMQLLYGIFFFTIWHLVSSYPDSLEKIINAFVCFTLWMFLMWLLEKHFAREKRLDYEWRVEQAKRLEEQGVLIEERNRIVSDGNKAAEKLSRRLDKESVVALIVSFLLTLVIAGLISTWIHPTVDLIWGRVPDEPKAIKLK